MHGKCLLSIFGSGRCRQSRGRDGKFLHVGEVADRHFFFPLKREGFSPAMLAGVLRYRFLLSSLTRSVHPRALARACSFSTVPLATSDAQGGVHKFPLHTDIPSCCYSVRYCRGSGPGGQAVNSSSNKAEVRIDLQALLQYLPDAVDTSTLERLKEKQSRRIASGSTLVVSSHEHRSAADNVRACLDKAQSMLHEASFVPPPPPVQPVLSECTRRKAILRRRKEGYLQKQRLQAGRE